MDFDEIKKEADVTVTSVDGTVERPSYGRRKTVTGPPQSAGISLSKVETEDEERHSTKIGRAWQKIQDITPLSRYALYIVPVAIILAIPIILLKTIIKDRDGNAITVQHIQLAGLFIWIEELWMCFWISRGIAACVPIAFQACCNIISTGIRKYTMVLILLQWPLTLLLWTCGGWSSSHIITIFDNNTVCNPKTYTSPGLTEDPCDGWPKLCQRIFLAGIVVASVFLAEKTFVKVIAIDYHRKQYEQKIKNSKQMIKYLDMLYDASRTLFQEGCLEFEEEDEAIRASSNEGEIWRSKTKANSHSKVDKDKQITNVRYSFRDLVAEISGKRLFDSRSAHSVVRQVLESESDVPSKALAKRLWESFTAEGNDALYKEDLIFVLGNDNKDDAEDIFDALDENDNNDVSLEEMTMLITRLGKERRDLNTSQFEIKEAIAVLDRLLTAVVLIAIAFIYAAFFSKAFLDKATSLWGIFTGLSFAFGGTITEFVGCCIFLFVKHPYDVGDRVNISDVQLIVEHVSLMYSVFRRVDSDTTCQIPHSVANTVWVENVNRSAPIKEKTTLSVASSTSSEDIKALEAELQKFVADDKHRRDFKPDFDIKLLSVGNLKQLDLCVEIKYKSNFSDEGVRSEKRNQFMEALLSACRLIPILPPGGSSPSLGDPKNPAYSVSVTDREAADARAKYAADTAAARLFPVGQGASFFPKALSTAVGKAPSLMGRRRSTKDGTESMRISQESQRMLGHPQSTYLQAPFR